MKDVVDMVISNHFPLLKNMTPKVHFSGENAVDQYKRLTPRFLWLLVEHWVELNHQLGYIIEK